MSRTSFQKGELLLVMLSLLAEGGPLRDRDILARVQGLLRNEYRVSPGEVLLALEAMEAERLVKVDADVAPTAYRVTATGSVALRRRCDAPVLERLGHACRRHGGGTQSESSRIEQAAILFSDIVNSTQLFDRVGDKEAHRIHREHFALLRRSMGEHGGREVKSLGDGLMVAFGSVRSAVMCALAMQVAVAACPDRLDLRIGVAWGETVYEDHDYFGRPVIVARRLCDAARGGDVIVSASDADLPPSATIEPLGALVLKGLSKPVPANALRPSVLALAA